MTKQQKIHQQGLRLVQQLEAIINGLKSAGPCPLDGRNALMNLRQQIRGLENRFPSRVCQGYEP